MGEEEDGTIREIRIYIIYDQGSQVTLVVKNPPANTGDLRDTDLIPGLGRSLGGGHDHPLKYSHLENPMDRERGLVGYSSKGLKESDTTEVT